MCGISGIESMHSCFILWKYVYKIGLTYRLCILISENLYCFFSIHGFFIDMLQIASSLVYKLCIIHIPVFLSLWHIEGNIYISFFHRTKIAVFNNARNIPLRPVN